jgi:Outer membrane lipoprotein-sorting protein
MNSPRLSPLVLAAAVFLAAAFDAAPLAQGTASTQRGAPPKPTPKPAAKPTPKAPPPPTDPREIVTETQKRGTVASQHYEGALQVLESGGKVSTKHWTYDRLGSNGTSKTIIRFTEPAEVKGVALLIFNYPDRASDQWMWTPALNRERRVATQDRRTRFFGTDFSFEDLEERDVARSQYVMSGTETIDGQACWKIDSTPLAGARSQYTRAVLWIRKSNFTYAQIDNYTDAKLIRRISYKNLEQIQGVWTARTLEVQDFTRNSRTTLTLDALKYNVPLADNQFTIEALRRG